MAKVANSFSTYQAVGNREDLSDTIYNIDPFDTPLVSTAGREDVSNRTYDWQTENLPAVNGDNAKQEGFELARGASVPTVRVKNVCQISSKDASVTGSQQDANAAGKPSEMSHQMAIMGKALKRDMEVIFGSAQPIVYGDDSGTPVPRRTRGFIHWLKTNVMVPTPPVSGTPTPVITLPASETAAYPAVGAGDRVIFTESLLSKVMTKAYNNGAEPSVLIVGPTLKRQVSGFQGRNSSQVMVGKSEVTNTVDIYAGDFGRLKVVPSRWIDPNVALLIDPSYVKATYYRRFRADDIAKIGDAETKMILMEWGTKVGNEAAHAALIGVKADPAIDPASMG